MSSASCALPSAHRATSRMSPPASAAASTEELSERALASLADVVVRGRKIVDVVTEDPLKVQLLHLEVELPYLEGTSLADFCAITVGETDAYETFRSFLRLKFLDLDQASESEQLHRELAKIGEDLRDGVRRVDGELKRIRSRGAVSVTGATVATVGATLVLVFGQDLAQAMSLLGASGGIWGAVNAAQAYNEQRRSVAERPYYYLWLLRRSTGRPRRPNLRSLRGAFEPAASLPRAKWHNRGMGLPLHPMQSSSLGWPHLRSPDTGHVSCGGSGRRET